MFGEVTTSTPPPPARLSSSPFSPLTRFHACVQYECPSVSTAPTVGLASSSHSVCITQSVVTAGALQSPNVWCDGNEKRTVAMFDVLSVCADFLTWLFLLLMPSMMPVMETSRLVCVFDLQCATCGSLTYVI